MNRAERRANNNKVAMWTTAEVTAHIRREHKKHLQEFVTNYNAVLALALHDKLGFGQKRSIRFIKHVAGLFGDLRDGHITMDYIAGVLKDEVKLVIK
jgi:hypothetical protein